MYVDEFCSIFLMAFIYLVVVRHDKRGMMSMANSGSDTNASQFFFTYAAQPHLNNKYTIFGQ